MKDFFRETPMFSLCGLNCALCTLHLGGHCPGCGGGEGNQSCAIARCSVQHGGVQFCYECAQYPCDKYAHVDEYDSFVACRNRKKDFERARQIGTAAYLDELSERAGALHFLLDCCNDGRKKSFFVAAASFLEPSELRSICAMLAAPDCAALSLAERAALAVRLLQDEADARGIALKLNRKPRKRE